MSGIQLCEPTELYNILNQTDLHGLPCIANRTYLLLLDVREYSAYEESHILTSRHSPQSSEGGDFQIPVDAEVETKQYCVVYDSCTADTNNKESSVYQCAKMLGELTSRKSILILKGGYESFSALYPYLKSIQIFYSPREMESLPLFPLEVFPGTVYIGTSKQVSNGSLMKSLAVKHIINASPDTPISVDDVISVKNVTMETDNLAQFREISQLIENYRAKKEPVVLVSDLGISRSIVLILAYLIKRNKWTLEKAWKVVKHTQSYIRPEISFMRQLSDFELEICEERTTNIAVPNLM